MTKAEVEQLQRDLNRFTDRFLERFAPLMVDGVRGPLTNRRIVKCKFYIGYTGERQRSRHASPMFRKRLNRPTSRKVVPVEMIELGEERRREQHERAQQRPPAGVTLFDGRKVARWMKPYLDFARNNGWQGTLNSGFRDPAHSEQLCFQICGAPSCRGLCAGQTSNHSGKTKPKGALDVSDFARFGQLMQGCPLEPRIFNDLPDDHVHFSATGH
jgi:hypothetical protein